MDTSACWWWRQTGLKAGEGFSGHPPQHTQGPGCVVRLDGGGGACRSPVTEAVLQGTDRAGGPAPGPILSQPPPGVHPGNQV